MYKLPSVAFFGTVVAYGVSHMLVAMVSGVITTVRSIANF